MGLTLSILSLAALSLHAAESDLDQNLKVESVQLQITQVATRIRMLQAESDRMLGEFKRQSIKDRKGSPLETALSENSKSLNEQVVRLRFLRMQKALLIARENGTAGAVGESPLTSPSVVHQTGPSLSNRLMKQIEGESADSEPTSLHQKRTGQAK
ncbi:MAG: hypothetical protein H7301_03680 [Cryobacterium sp.]|nr:hypothetical protein [Oligoflexia bacterium]